MGRDGDKGEMAGDAGTGEDAGEAEVQMEVPVRLPPVPGTRELMPCRCPMVLWAPPVLVLNEIPQVQGPGAGAGSSRCQCPVPV